MGSFGEGPPKIKPNPLPELVRIDISVLLYCSVWLIF